MSAQEREAYERHLVECPTCRAEVSDLAGLPTILMRLDASAAAAITIGGESALPGLLDPAAADSPDRPVFAEAVAWAGPTRQTQPRDPLLPKILDRAQARRRSERRRRRLQTVAAALTAACLGVLTVLGLQLLRPRTPSTPTGPAGPALVAMREVAQVPLTAKVALESIGGGTKLRMQCAYKAGGGGSNRWTYTLVVVPRQGVVEEVSSWTAGYGDEYDVTARSKIALPDILRVELRKGDGTPLLIHDA
jgi:hypothetical protein